ncbi:MAG: PHP-associated domain-containing protein [Methylacidiphilales bacterium]|nr:PHP-associated domain-containing protein [Candidatus Methylacidiphilales bacterium]
MPFYRTDFHHHCDCDPVDCLDYSAYELVDQLQERGINALAITPHTAVFEDPKVIEYAASKNMLLIPGAELVVEGYEVVLLNISPNDVPETCTFDHLKELRRQKGESLFIFAPHPFYPRSSCAGAVLDTHAGLFDAVEFAHFYFSFWNPNRKAVAWAGKNNKPVIANSDSHHLTMAGLHFSIVEAPRLDAVSIFRAIRSGKVTYQSKGKNLIELARFLVKVVLNQLVRKTPRRLRRFAEDHFLD